MFDCGYLCDFLCGVDWFVVWFEGWDLFVDCCLLWFVFDCFYIVVLGYCVLVGVLFGVVDFLYVVWLCWYFVWFDCGWWGSVVVVCGDGLD